MNELDQLMRNSVELLKGPHDPNIDRIIAYLRQYKAKIDAGGKPKRIEFDEALPSTPVPPSPRRQFRRY